MVIGRWVSLLVGVRVEVFFSFSVRTCMKHTTVGGGYTHSSSGVDIPESVI